MTVKELRDKVLAGGGKLVVGSLTITGEEGKDVDIHTKNELLAWVGSSVEEDKTVEDGFSAANKVLIKNISEAAQFAQFVGIKVGEIEPIEVEKIVKVQDMEGIRLAGKVEAYEAILIGRAITASN